MFHNTFFQATDADPEEMHKELEAHSKSLHGRVFKGLGNPLPIEEVDFGGKFEFKAKNYISAQLNKPAAEAKVGEMKKRCLTFLLQFVEQVDKRLPATSNLFKGLSTLHRRMVLDATARAQFNKQPLAHLRETEHNLTEEQYVCTKMSNQPCQRHCSRKNIFTGYISQM